MKSAFHHFLIFLVGILFLTACNSTKYVKENEYLLTKNTVEIDGKKTTNPEITSFVIQRPNSKLFGLPLELNFYNLGNKNYDSIHQEKIKNFQNRNNLLDKILSKKQTLNLIHKRKNFNNWFLTKGEEPVILDTKKAFNSAKNIRTYFFNNGYFNARTKVSFFNSLKKSETTYSVTKGTPFNIGKITYSFPSKSIDSIVKANKALLAIKEGEQYKLDNFKQTITNLTSLLRNNGFYHFNESLISFREIDTLAKNNSTPVNLVIENRKIKEGKDLVELPTKRQTIKNVNVFTDYSYSKRNAKYEIQKSHKGIQFFAHQKLKYRRKVLANSIFITPNAIYSDEAVELTRKHLRSLNNFKSVKINHVELDNDELNTNIVLTPQKKYGIGVNTEIIHSNIKQLGLSGGFNFINRNLFRGAEIFQLSLQGSIFDTSANLSNNNDDTFNAHEFGIDASLEFPRFIFPFLTKIIPRKMTPRTKVVVGTSFQRNIGLDKQKLSGIINYNWKSSKKNSHILELLNLQFINNLNDQSYYTIYSSEFNKIQAIKNEFRPDTNLTINNANNFISQLTSNSTFNAENPEESRTLLNILKRREIIVSNNIIPTTSYTFEHNSKKALSDNKYNFFKIKLSSAGNLSSRLFKNKEFENIPISEFVKVDIDFRKFWSNSKNSSLAFRTFVGTAIPTGSSISIPFITSYFAGGSNDIRAWKAYELGPGSSNSGLEFNIGNLKILSSLEYRFKIINSIHGALFVDAGNIWNLKNNTTAEASEIFNDFNDLSNIAIGSGAGIRYDFNFLVLRLDLAFKTYEPYLTDNKWFSNYDIRNSVLNIGINYPF